MSEMYYKEGLKQRCAMVEYGLCARSFRHKDWRAATFAPIAQLDRALGFPPKADPPPAGDTGSNPVRRIDFSYFFDVV